MVLASDYDPVWELQDPVCPLELARRGFFVLGRVEDIILPTPKSPIVLYKVTWCGNKHGSDDFFVNGSREYQGHEIASWCDAVTIATPIAVQSFKSRLQKKPVQNGTNVVPIR